jgi:predicted kinase
MTITVLMGAPGSGKTTWLTEHRNDELVIDTHAVRTVQSLDVGAYMAHIRKVGANAASQGKPLIVDATNTYPQHRLYWLAIARRHDLTAHLVAFDTSLALCLAAQRRRANPAPDRIVIKHHRLMRIALTRVHSEGWDDIDVLTRPTMTPPIPHPDR